jgi:hypothetical protein
MFSRLSLPAEKETGKSKSGTARGDGRIKRERVIVGSPQNQVYIPQSNVLIEIMRDHLFLLKPGFEVGDGKRYYCPHSAQVEGVLSFYPSLRLEMDVTYLKFPRPRQAIVDLIGEENQSAPVLVVGDAAAIPKQLKPGNAKGRSFFAGDEAITEYLALRYGIGRPHKG